MGGEIGKVSRISSSNYHTRTDSGCKGVIQKGFLISSVPLSSPMSSTLRGDNSKETNKKARSEDRAVMFPWEGAD